MNAKDGRSHLGSEPHNKKLIASGGNPEFWNCNLCNSTMSLSNKPEHLAGRRHAENLKGKDLSKANYNKAKKAKYGSKNSSQHTTRDAEPQIYIPTQKSYPGPSHPNGKQLIKEYDIRDVYDDVYDMPLEAWEGAQIKLPNGKNTLVTAREVQAVRNVYESWGTTSNSQRKSAAIPTGGVALPTDLNSD